MSLYKRTEVVGRGKFGVVYKGYNKQTKQVVAIKVLNLDTEEDEVADVQLEIQFLAELKNVPNVTHYYGSFLNDTKLWIIMDYCAGGSLRTLLKAGVFEEKYIGVILREVLYALSAVHKLGVIHRDIKAANVLITKEGNVELCDFGVAAKITSSALKRTTMAGTPYWMAPEVIREGDAYNSKADIWSLGITLYEIATGNPPYCDKDAMWAMQLISKSTPPRLEGREYSAALKECIALCLDENPEERLSADELMKCKLVRFYKNYPKPILKEVISRYLLWRDHNSSRDSVFVSLEDGIPENEDDHKANQIENAIHGSLDHLPGDSTTTNQIQVKWDFDSLSSKEYIIENDIDLEKVDDTYYNEDSVQDSYPTLPTLQLGHNTYGTSGNTSTLNPYSSTLNRTANISNSTMTRPSVPSNEIPKSLQMLFEDEAETSPPSNGGLYEIPKAISAYEERTDSPTIEIPDMDNLANFNSTSSTALNSAHPPLNKPPTLYHSQSASGKLESRFGSTSTSNRPRKKTISNSLSSTGGNSNTLNTIPAGELQGQNQLQLVQTQGTTPHTPPYSVHSNLKTPSPKPPQTSALLSSAGLANATGSPSKSMKALQNNANPLLQPINFKLNAETGNTGTTPTPAGAVQPPTASGSISQATSTASSIPSKGKRSRAGFHIQMPTPSNTFNPLSALTNEQFEQGGQDENINQFGINPSQVGHVPLTMTPVTEKEHPFIHGEQEIDKENEQAKDKTETSGLRQMSIAPPKKPSLSGSSTNTTPVSSNQNLTGANLFLPRSSVSSVSSIAPSAAALSTNLQGTKFPVIPQINGDFFIDSTPKLKLVNELDMMIRLFNQGLDSLEENL
ncbi:Pkinase-domain-containing protein [Suhomyces tanzawaensis NRRL Y-17324]|uniref:non-specific serine/threonine protein kinase n=1 Tax=Suhomyces tanzawaensis NRRL Y-17324 TaxID=984487 RepID=A0A1E4SLV5_9ASCO|nr:Pkinase-domain-containing protein [Suhomyces tanzawaensis NRRL Y-17324]ODV80506.1 Pkinase-domain-containing protein [Suhomyces tanzawaensis NRRL Y-17324]